MICFTWFYHRHYSRQMIFHMQHIASIMIRCILPSFWTSIVPTPSSQHLSILLFSLNRLESSTAIHYLASRCQCKFMITSCGARIIQTFSAFPLLACSLSFCCQIILLSMKQSKEHCLPSEIRVNLKKRENWSEEGMLKSAKFKWLFYQLFKKNKRELAGIVKLLHYNVSKVNLFLTLRVYSWWGAKPMWASMQEEN